jgi:hypothetical protein
MHHLDLTAGRIPPEVLEETSSCPLVLRAAPAKSQHTCHYIRGRCCKHGEWWSRLRRGCASKPRMGHSPEFSSGTCKISKKVGLLFEPKNGHHLSGAARIFNAFLKRSPIMRKFCCPNSGRKNEATNLTNTLNVGTSFRGQKLGLTRWAGAVRERLPVGRPQPGKDFASGVET